MPMTVLLRVLTVTAESTKYVDRPIFPGEAIVDPVLSLASNAALEAKDKDGWTSLHDAERRGHILIFWAPPAAGADIEAANNWEMTALRSADIPRLSGYLRPPD